MENKKTTRYVLVTGGLGFIGSAFLRRYVPKHPEICFVNFDAELKGSNHAAVAVIKDAPNYYYVKGDITDQDSVSRVFNDYPITDVIHWAAQTDVDRSIKDPIYTAEVNYTGTGILLEASRKAVGFRRFVYVSTDEVYGTVGPGDPSKTELDRLAPGNPYSASKAAAEHVVLAYANTHGLDVVITRGANTFGPFQDYTKLIPVAVKALRDGARIPIYGDGKQVREWLPVDLHADGVYLAWRNGKSGAIYNISTGVEQENLSLVRILHDSVLPEQPIEDYTIHVTDRPGHDRRYSIDNSKAREELQWAVDRDFSIDDIRPELEDTAKWYYRLTN